MRFALRFVVALCLLGCAVAQAQAPEASRQRVMVTAGVGAFGQARNSNSGSSYWGAYRRVELAPAAAVSVRYERDLAGAAFVGGMLGYANTGMAGVRRDANEHWFDMGVLIGLHRAFSFRHVGLEPRLVVGAGYSEHVFAASWVDAARRATSRPVPRSSPGMNAYALAGLGLRLTRRIGVTVETGYTHHRLVSLIPSAGTCPSCFGGPWDAYILVSRVGQWTTQLSLTVHR